MPPGLLRSDAGTGGILVAHTVYAISIELLYSCSMLRFLVAFRSLVAFGKVLVRVAEPSLFNALRPASCGCGMISSCSLL